MKKSFERQSPSLLVVLSVAVVFLGFISNVVECRTEGRHNESSDATVVTAHEKAVIFKKAFKQLLKLKNVPGNPSHVPLSTSPPPPYMLELYDKYRRGDINLKGNRKGNTVRSILAIRGNMNGDQMLLFNLSGISDQEEMLQGELHYYKRRKVKWPDHASIPEYRMKFVGTHVGSNKVTVTPLDTVQVPRRSRGWQVHNVTQILKECRKPSVGSESHLLGIKFLGLNSHSKFVGLPLNKFLKMNSQPFLIVFSNDQETNTIENLENHMTEFLGPTNKEAKLTDTSLDSRRKENIQETAYPAKIHFGNNDPSMLKHWYSQQPKEGSPSRVARSVLDNELPENSIYSNFIPQTSPNVLQSRNRPKQKPVAIIPYPHMMTFGTQRKKGQKNRRRQNRRLPNMWQKQPDLHQQPRHENDATLDVTAGEEDVTLCRKRKLVVDFADIGWGEWIISPKSFEAHYCSGACSFPLMKNMKPSNHATIQSIVNAIGIHPNVPAPCCVADVMSSVTLLYFDEDRNVVLKNYPSMTVESCACR